MLRCRKPHEVYAVKLVLKNYGHADYVSLKTHTEVYNLELHQPYRAIDTYKSSSEFLTAMDGDSQKESIGKTVSHMYLLNRTNIR